MRRFLLLLLVIGLFPSAGWAQIGIPLLTRRQGAEHKPVILQYFPLPEPAWGIRLEEDTLLLQPQRPDSLGIALFQPDGDDNGRLVVRTDTSTRVFRLRFREGTLTGIGLEGGGAADIDSDSLHRFYRIRHRDREGRLLRQLDYRMAADNRMEILLSDSLGPLKRIVNAYEGDRLVRQEAFDADGRPVRRSRYAYWNSGGRLYAAGDTVERYREADTLVDITTFRYAQDSLHPYPLETLRRQAGRETERITYTYPFCPPPGYGPVADSLLRHRMPHALLSKTHWRDGRQTDSISFLYKAFPGVEGPFYRVCTVLRSREGAAPDTCLHFVAYDSLSREPVRILNGKRQEARGISPELDRWWAPDPTAERERAQYAELCSEQIPQTEADPRQGSSFLFDDSGAFLSRVETVSPSSVVAWQGFGLPPIHAQMADPENDPFIIDLYTQLRIISSGEIRDNLSRAGAFEREHHGFFRGCSFLWKQSGYGGTLDFAMRPEYGIHRNELLVTDSWKEGLLAQNAYNYGNFLWGATAHELGVPLWVCRLGSHINNFFLSPDTRGQFDSPDDQLSISAGYHWR